MLVKAVDQATHAVWLLFEFTIILINTNNLFKIKLH